MSNSNKQLGRPVNPNSATHQAHSIYQRLTADGIKDGNVIRRAFVSELTGKNSAPISAGTAQVYYHNCRKALGLTVVRPRTAKVKTVAVSVPAVANEGSAESVAETV